MRYTKLLVTFFENNHVSYGSEFVIVVFFIGGSDRSTIISGCEVVPTFCTNHMGNIRQLERQVSLVIMMNCMSTQTGTKQKR